MPCWLEPLRLVLVCVEALPMYRASKMWLSYANPPVQAPVYIQLFSVHLNAPF